MTSKERETAFQHWQSMIVRETRDLASLERIANQALHDRDVRADSALEGRVRAYVADCRAEFERQRRSDESSVAVQRSSYSGRGGSGGGRGGVPRLDGELRPASPVPPAPPAPPVRSPPHPAQVLFDTAARALSDAYTRGAESEARAAYDQMKTAHTQSPNVVTAAALNPYELKLQKLSARLDEFRAQIAALVERAVAASRAGDEPAAAKLVQRLSAIHVTYPQLLDESRLREVHAEMLRASEAREDRLITRKLIKREEAVSLELERIAAAVRAFHQFVCASPRAGPEFRAAETRYLQTVRDVQAHDKDWLAGFVLELADVLAEWNRPPQTAQDRVDRFLGCVRASLKHIHTQMRAITTELDQPPRQS